MSQKQEKKHAQEKKMVLIWMKQILRGMEKKKTLKFMKPNDGCKSLQDVYIFSIFEK